MIPKIIHYCWLSNDPIPSNIQHYMDSWKKYLPDYEFIHWNFDKFDKSSSRWGSEAFDNKKYAFAADYIRLYALYHYGGIYLDMDVEVLKSFNPFLSLQTMMGWQYGKGKGLEVAAFGVERHSSWVKLCLDSYDKRPFVLPDGSFDILQPLPLQVEKTLLNNGYDLISVTSLEDAMKIDEASMKIAIFPATFFSPKSFTDGVIRTTTNTYSIHHFAASWLPFYTRWEIKFWHLLRLPNFRILHFIGQLLKKVHLKK